MKLVSYLKDDQPQLALLENGLLYDTDALHHSLPSGMSMFLNYWDDAYHICNALLEQIREGGHKYKGTPLEDKILLAPVPAPSSCRDAYAFRQHVATARRNRNAPMAPEFDQFPVFYFTNHNSVTGPGDIVCMPDHFHKLDFELEVAIVISKTGRNIRAEQADEYIAGLMIMNDFSARVLQSEEMKLNLGPAKGKDFATSYGPWLVSMDELEEYLTEPFPGHTGKAYNLSMKATVNGSMVSEGNMKDMNWTFAEIIERASYGVSLFPGDIIGSGTVGTGCFLEINGTKRFENPDATQQWLQEGDEITLEVEGLGSLTNKILKDTDDFSILALKK